MGALLDPGVITAAFALAREATTAAFDRQDAIPDADRLLLTIVVPTIEAAVVGWEIGSASGAMPRSAQRALLGRVGVPDTEPTAAERVAAAAERAQTDARGVGLYLPTAELTARSLIGTWIQLAPRLHPEWISWPSRRASYADLASPRTLLEHVEAGERLIEAAFQMINAHHHPQPTARPLIALLDVAAAIDRRGLGEWPGLTVR